VISLVRCKPDQAPTNAREQRVHMQQGATMNHESFDPPVIVVPQSESTAMRVAFIATSYMTTQGHVAIYNAVKRSLLRNGEERNVLLLPLFSLAAASVESLCGIFRPHIIIVDFPWTSAAHLVHDLAAKLATMGDDRPRLGVIDMYSTEYSSVPDGLFDFSIEAEPHACNWAAPDVIPAWAILNDDGRLDPLDSSVPAQRALLAAWDEATAGKRLPGSASNVFVLQTGSAEEQEALLFRAREHYLNRDPSTRVIGSLSLPQPSVRFARLADTIVSASGYSAVWELFMMGVLDKVTFMSLDRPLEDLKRRMDVAWSLRSGPGNRALARQGMRQFALRLAQMHPTFNNKHILR